MHNIYIYIYIYIYIRTPLHVSMHLHHLQPVLSFYCAKGTKMIKITHIACNMDSPVGVCCVPVGCEQYRVQTAGEHADGSEYVGVLTI